MQSPGEQPLVVLLSSDLACSSQVAGAAARRGLQLQTVMQAGNLADRIAVLDARLVILDLQTPALDCAQVVQQVRAHCPAARVLAFGPHVHESRLQAAREAGCDEVMSRGQFYAGLDDVLAGA